MKIPEVRRLNLQFVENGVKESLTGGKQRRMVQARSVLCYWGTRELGMSAVGISKKLNIASSTASESAMRGRQIVEEHEWKLLEEDESEERPLILPQLICIVR